MRALYLVNYMSGLGRLSSQALAREMAERKHACSSLAVQLCIAMKCLEIIDGLLRLLRRYQQAANKLGGNNLGGAGEEGLGEVLGGFGMG